MVMVPPPLVLQNLNNTSDRGRNSYFQGEVLNTTVQPLYNVQIEARIYDTRGTLLAQGTGTTTVPAVFPNQPTPFTVRVPPYDYFFDRRYEIVLTGWSNTSPVEYRNLDVTNLRAEQTIPPGPMPEPPTVTSLSMTVRNPSSQSLAAVQATVWCKNNSQPLSVNIQTITDRLAPGAQLDWTTVVNSCTELPLQVLIQGQVVR
jgi:hypothetical protein